MSISKTTKIIIAAIAAVLLIIAIVLVVKNGGSTSNSDLTTMPGGNTSANATGYDITGVWYSDRENGDTFTLNTDGNYTSSNWLANGKYTVDGDVITLVDAFGDSRTLTLTASDSAYMLRYDGAAAHSYYRTEKEATAAHEQHRTDDEAMQSVYEATLMQILTTGEWIYTDAFATTTLQFTENSFVITYSGSKNIAPATHKHSYIITNFKEINGNYSVTMDIHDETRNQSFDNSGVSITVADGNIYTITCGNFTYATRLTKTLNIDLTESQTTTAALDNGTKPEATAQSGNEETNGEQVIVHDDGRIESIRQISRNDTPDRSEHMAALAELVEKEIYGTWQGTFEDMPNENTVYLTFTFSTNGTYAFSDGSIDETGKFSLTHISDSDKYHSVLHLVASDGTQKEHRFYFSGTDTFRMTIEGDTHPTYYRK